MSNTNNGCDGRFGRVKIRSLINMQVCLQFVVYGAFAVC